ncbi:hypothetical protein JIN85_12835 [Luteolibacter pohnpeiensis]|uniref:Uncharacterized protein n=1 Tax=Luteolibacter pohnpeiensis TaxID=454153 RepID=A0A934S8J2_9BACT|nr:hypothetical protein [Luteolibacter pohnpeiensis]MBK1883305.1 hypothetical protein [Luteolibacter pohnpeiensis]
MTLRILRNLAIFIAIVGLAKAQISVRLDLTSTQYLTGEPVIAQVAITNNSGRELNFSGSTRLPWIDFIVKKGDGSLVVSPQKPAFGAMTIPVGQTMARKFSLSSFYYLSQQGNYSVTAIVRMPGNEESEVPSNRRIFNLSPGRPYITPVKVGVPGKPNETREYRVMSFTPKNHQMIYVQVVDGKTGIPMRTFPLGEILSVRKPQISVDRNLQLHVLYLENASIWDHCIINSDGQIVDRKYHNRSAQGDPSLYTSPDGVVSVANSTPYDPVAVAEAKSKIHKASDRPSFIYQ